MARYRVYDQQTSRLLSERTASTDTVDLAHEGEYLSANPGDVILAPSIKSGEVLYIRIKSPAHSQVPEPRVEAFPAEAPAVPDCPPKQSKQYVATGFLGLDGELEEELPEPPKPWWKKLFID